MSPLQPWRKLDCRHASWLDTRIVTPRQFLGSILAETEQNRGEELDRFVLAKVERKATPAALLKEIPLSASERNSA